MSSPVAVDFESYFNTKLKYGLRTMGAEDYCASELFDCYLISVCDGTTTWAGHPRDFNWESLRGRHWLSHNRRFDNSVYNELVRRKLAPQLNPVAWDCTSNMTSYLCNRRSLKESVEHLLGVSVSKDYRGVADGKNWPQDYSEAEREQVLAAGRQDALRCWQLFDKFGSRWPTIERRLSNITIDQGIRGVQIDTAKLDTYIWQAHELLKNTEKVIPWIADSEEDDWAGFTTKPTSTKCIGEQCRRVGIPGAPIKSDDEDVYTAWETKHAPQHPWIIAVGEWRSINKLLRTFETMKSRLRADGTLPFSLKYYGAHTGRWAGDSRINFQNMRKKPVLSTQQGLTATDSQVEAALKERASTGKFPEWVKYELDFRSLILPRPGKKMIVSDLSQIEPRVLAWLAGDWEFLKLVATGESPYVSHSRVSMGFTGDKMDKESDMYRLAKARVLALGYGCGAERFIDMAKTLAGLDITKDDPEWIEVVQPFTGKVSKVSGYGSNSKRIVQEFRDQNPLIAGEDGIWRKLGDAFKRSIGEDFVMTLPNGRTMRYEKIRASVKLEKDPETGKVTRKNVFTADIGGRRTPCYGGRLTENLTQAVARDVFAEHIVALEDRGYTNLFGCHDEVVLEVDPSVTAQEVEWVMSQCPKWLPGCPIAAVAKEVSYYCK